MGDPAAREPRKAERHNVRILDVAKCAEEFGRIVQLAEQTAVTNPTVSSSVRVRVLSLKFQSMKQQSEQRTDQAVKLLLQTLEQNVTDTGIILDEFEDTHDDYELRQSKQYSALNAGYFAMKDAIDKINDQLNKK